MDMSESDIGILLVVGGAGLFVAAFLIWFLYRLSMIAEINESKKIEAAEKGCQPCPSGPTWGLNPYDFERWRDLYGNGNLAEKRAEYTEKVAGTEMTAEEIARISYL